MLIAEFVWNDIVVHALERVQDFVCLIDCSIEAVTIRGIDFR